MTALDILEAMIRADGHLLDDALGDWIDIHTEDWRWALECWQKGEHDPLDDFFDCAIAAYAMTLKEAATK